MEKNAISAIVNSKAVSAIVITGCFLISITYMVKLAKENGVLPLKNKQ